MDRRRFIQTLAAAAAASQATWAAAKPASDVRLIAHRGGVVDATHPENSAASLEEAIARGYWMAEVDVRRSRDGVAFLHHDRDFQRQYGHKGRAAEMDWAEIAQLRGKDGVARPMRFAELAERCKGRIGLMLDMKSEPNPPAFYQAIEDALVANALMGQTYILTDVETERRFAGKLPWAISEDVLRETAARGELSPVYHYLFAGARTVQPESIALARKHGLDVVAAANVGEFEGEASLAPVRAALKRAYDLGVRAFQIDSAFEGFLPSYALSLASQYEF